MEPPEACELLNGFPAEAMARGRAKAPFIRRRPMVARAIRSFP